MDEPGEKTPGVTPVVRITSALGTEKEDCPGEDKEREVPNWNGG